MLRPISTVVVLFLLVASSASSAAITEAAEKVFRQGQISDDYYAAGGEVSISADVEGDAILASGDLSFDGSASGDLSAAGGSVSIQGSIADDVRIAGGQVDIDASIGDDLLVTGGDINLKAKTQVEGDTRIAGGDVTSNATLNGDLAVAAGNLTLGGRVKGDVDFFGDRITLLDGAVIEGDLNYRATDEAPLNPNATVMGSLQYSETEWREDSEDVSFLFPLTLMVAAILLLIVFPHYSVGSARQLAKKPLNSVGLGLLFLVLAPIVALVLMVTVIGIWVGLALLLLYAISLLAGYLVGCIFIGDWGASLLKQNVEARGRRMLSVALAIILLAVIGMVPFLGGLIGFLVLVTGVGAGLLQLQYQYRQSTV